jgi:hypothetical protein
VALRTAVIGLELYLDDDTLTGGACDDAGAAREFVGWLGLVGAIDALLAADATSTGTEVRSRGCTET